MNSLRINFLTLNLLIGVENCAGFWQQGPASVSAGHQPASVEHVPDTVYFAPAIYDIAGNKRPAHCQQ